MKKLLALIFALFFSHASAQTLNNLPPNTVVGRLGAGTAGPAQAIPFAAFGVQIGPFIPGLSGAFILNTPDQVITGGANITTLALTPGNVTIDCGLRPIQSIIDGGVFTITAPANDGSCLLLVTNNASAGAISFSGFSVGTNTGDPLDTTNGHNFSLFIWRAGGISGYRVAAHQ